jgi:hypothetical protein
MAPRPLIPYCDAYIWSTAKLPRTSNSIEFIARRDLITHYPVNMFSKQRMAQRLGIMNKDEIAYIPRVLARRQMPSSAFSFMQLPAGM